MSCRSLHVVATDSLFRAAFADLAGPARAAFKVPPPPSFLGGGMPAVARRGVCSSLIRRALAPSPLFPQAVTVQDLTWCLDAIDPSAQTTGLSSVAPVVARSAPPLTNGSTPRSPQQQSKPNRSDAV
jgi:hypothetical protein